jgi:hypothetical protein
VKALIEHPIVVTPASNCGYRSVIDAKDRRRIEP